jgi:RNA polymerase sigma-70 factor, ECF subfamily
MTSQMAQPAAGADELHAAMRHPEARGFENLMRRYNRQLFRAARGIVGNDAEAQDVVQETWLRAFTGLETFRGDASVPTWLTRIAINQALTQQRKLGRLVLWDSDAATEESEMPSHHDPRDRIAASPEDELARTQLRRQLVEAVDTLPPIYRSVFMLRAVEGLGVDDTASALQVSADVVKTRFLRARAMLRAALDADYATLEPGLHGFDGQRCDDMVSVVLGRLRAAGVLRDH